MKRKTKKTAGEGDADGSPTQGEGELVQQRQ